VLALRQACPELAEGLKVSGCVDNPG